MEDGLGREQFCLRSELVQHVGVRVKYSCATWRVKVFKGGLIIVIFFKRVSNYDVNF